jgi:hypothetical protein
VAVNYKILGQLRLTANADGTIFQVPAGHQYIVSSLVMCNVGTDIARPNVFAIYDTATQVPDATNQIRPPTVMQPKNTEILTLGMTFEAGDVMSAFNVQANPPFDGPIVTFTAFGSDNY